jgi:hypothetical protein
MLADVCPSAVTHSFSDTAAASFGCLDHGRGVRKDQRTAENITNYRWSDQRTEAVPVR